MAKPTENPNDHNKISLYVFYITRDDARFLSSLEERREGADGGGGAVIELSNSMTNEIENKQ